MGVNGSDDDFDMNSSQVMNAVLFVCPPPFYPALLLWP